MTKFFLVISK